MFLKIKEKIKNLEKNYIKPDEEILNSIKYGLFYLFSYLVILIITFPLIVGMYLLYPIMIFLSLDIFEVFGFKLVFNLLGSGGFLGILFIHFYGLMFLIILTIIFSFFIGAILKYKNKKEIMPLILSSMIIFFGIFLILFVNYSDSIHKCSFISNSNLDKDSCYYNKFSNSSFQEMPTVEQCNFLHERYRDYCFFDLAKITKDISLCENVGGLTSEFECVSGLIKSKDEIGYCLNLLWNQGECVSILAKKINDISLCELIYNKKEKDTCELKISLNTEGIEHCYRINDSDTKKYCINKFKFENSELSFNVPLNYNFIDASSYHYENCSTDVDIILQGNQVGKIKICPYKVEFDLTGYGEFGLKVNSVEKINISDEVFFKYEMNAEKSHMYIKKYNNSWIQIIKTSYYIENENFETDFNYILNSIKLN
jgi:hypothetical protein